MYLRGFPRDISGQVSFSLLYLMAIATPIYMKWYNNRRMEEQSRNEK